MTQRLPALFIGHGTPMNALEINRYTSAWHALGESIRPRPRAILCISAHWYARAVGVTAMAQPRTIHDFYGFPPELHAVKYPAPGDPDLANEVAALLAPQCRVALDEGWGLDHGAWSVLVHLFPDADVPVVQLAIDSRQPAEFHWNLGAALEPLRERGVLLVGSGNVVHNLRAIDFGKPDGFDWAQRFDEHVRDALERGDREALVRYESHPDAVFAVPTPDHYLPLLYIAGAKRSDDRVATVVEGLEAGSLSMRSVAIG